MNITIQPSSVAGTLAAPPSKSLMQRACAAALLRKGTSYIYNAGDSDDDRAALHIINHLGAETVKEPNGCIHIKSSGVQPISSTINCGQSGLAARMFTPLIALGNRLVTLTGEGSLLARPMEFYNAVLPALGVSILAKNGRLPFDIQGPLIPASITIDGSLSSQFITGLIIAYAGGVTKPVTITVNNLTSKPYINLTLDIIKAFDLNVPVNNDYYNFVFHPIAKSLSEDIQYTVEGDWSSASFMLVAAAIAGNISVKGLNIDSSQGDKGIVSALKQAGSNPLLLKDEIIVRKTKLQAFEFDCTDCPDLFPPLVVLAAYCPGTTAIKGVNRLKYKESNRAIALQQEFGKMGVEISNDKDVMYIKGGGILHGSIIDPHNDHRIAMACAIAALQANCNTTITNATVVNKSYPGFFNDLKKLNGDNVLIC